MEPPKELSLTIEDSDVKNDVIKIISDMDRLRLESISQRGFSSELMDEYLHLTYRLSSNIEAVADDDSISQMQQIAGAMDNNPELLSYDPLQDGYWKKQSPEFVQDLEDLLIGFSRDHFNTVDSKHHVAQMIKFIGAANESNSEKIRIYDTIKPFQKGIMTPRKKGIASRVAGSLLGDSYELKSVDDLTVEASGNLENIEELMHSVKELGFKELRITIPTGLSDKVTRVFSASKVVGIAPEVSESNLFLRKTLGKTAKVLSPIYLPVVGSLPTKVQNKVTDYIKPGFEWAGTEAGVVSGFLTSLTVSFGVGVPIFFLANSFPLTLFGSYLSLEGAARAVMACNNKKVCGSLMTKLPMWPFEPDYARKKNEKSVLVDLNLRNLSPEEKQVVNPIDFFDSVSTLEIPGDVENDLVWGRKNNSSFGNKFLKFVYENANKQLPSNFPLKKDVSRNNGYLYLHHTSTFDGYSRSSGLICTKDSRYVITTITKGNVDHSEEIPEIVFSSESPASASENIIENLSPKYLHLRRFEGGVCSHDYEELK